MYDKNYTQHLCAYFAKVCLCKINNMEEIGGYNSYLKRSIKYKVAVL